MTTTEEEQKQAEEEAAAAEEAKTESEAAAAALIAEAAAAAEKEEGGIEFPSEYDVLWGRGASVNANRGNQVFRALCFKRKPEFDAGSHAAKRRVATEIVAATKANNGRFLKRKTDKGLWFEVSNEKAILKACQVMRDYQRPDRVALRAMAAASGTARKRQRIISTPMDPEDMPPTTEPLAPIKENPFGVHDHDVLSGRGAFINGHVGNAHFRKLCLDRKAAFDAGSYSEKRAVASEIVTMIRGMDPPGRFLRRAKNPEDAESKYDNFNMPVRGLDGSWEELSDDKAIHKACQVMRDIARPDRTGENKREYKGGRKKKDKDDSAAAQAKDSITMLAETTAEATAVDEAVAATEEALDKALDSVPGAKANKDEENETAEV